MCTTRFTHPQMPGILTFQPLMDSSESVSAKLDRLCRAGGLRAKPFGQNFGVLAQLVERLNGINATYPVSVLTFVR